ncbi:MAG: membrane lipoprotein lipid attachment site-containing protein [Clostridia bacterium]|nr:membrane lipoprotein lipid attachment site-containing protein [Clostridia bacterium]
MKKIFCLLLCALILSGCTAVGDGVTAITAGISFVADIEYDDEIYTYTVEISENGDTVMTAVSENCLKGTVMRFSDNEICFECNEISQSNEISTLPEGTISDFIYAVFSDASRKSESVVLENDKYCLKGKTDKYDYNMYLGETGLPIEITDKANGITAVIKNVGIK